MEATFIMNNKKTLCLVAGRSGGHIIPCLTLAEKYLQQKQYTAFIFFTSKKNLDHRIIANYSCIDQIISLSLENIPYKQPWKYPLYIISFLWSCFVSIYRLWEIKPEKIISTGGYIALPVCIAGRLLKIPIELWELNAIPGKSALLLARFSTTINTCFKEAQHYFPFATCTMNEYPIRFEKHSSLSNKTFTKPIIILILGGSQGSQFLNTLMQKWLITAHDLFSHIHIIHQTGNNFLDAVKKFYRDNDISADVFDFDDQLYQYYQQATIVICRAGAGTLFETVFFKKPCITIPLETKQTNHQYANACSLAEQYPNIITVFRQHDIDVNSASFFSTLRNYITKAIETA